jgi:hypothetical protein
MRTNSILDSLRLHVRRQELDNDNVRLAPVIGHTLANRKLMEQRTVHHVWILGQAG